MTDNPQVLDGVSTAAIQKDATYATYLELPRSEELLVTRRAVKVAGTLDGYPLHRNAPQSAAQSVSTRDPL